MSIKVKTMKNYILWAIKILEQEGYCLTASAPEKIQDMPWSEVYRFKTTQGKFYLKKNTTGFSDRE